jgi:hypothetical protein
LKDKGAVIRMASLTVGIDARLLVIDKFPAPELNVMSAIVVIAPPSVDAIASELVLNVIGELVVKLPAAVIWQRSRAAPPS